MDENSDSGVKLDPNFTDLEDMDPDGGGHHEALDKLDILRARLDKIELFLVDFGWGE